MHRSSAFVLFAAVSFTSLTVLADSKADPKFAGKKGYVTAYDSDQTTVLDVQSCDMKGNAHDYPECGKALRERVKSDICVKKGKGKHEWYYQVSDNSKSKHSTTCK
jgi:hypothetical protein